jgi:DNA-binding HxlR family transcriptional regulator
MPKRSSPQPRSGCPISIALELFGDRWSLLIVRDLMFKGLKTFNEFQNAGEGIATNILTDRLARLEAAGVVAKLPDREDARKYVYRLTPKGIDLAPVLVELVLWSAKHEDTEAPPAVVRQMRSHREEFLSRTRDEWRKQSDSGRTANTD